VWRLCSQQRLWSVFSKKRGVNRKAGPSVHDDLVLRGFTATKLNQLWLTDITEHWTDEGKLYLCAIKADLSHLSSVGSPVLLLECGSTTERRRIRGQEVSSTRCRQF